MDRSSRLRSRIEPLEDRIAPALLINGANLLGGSSPSTGETSVGGNNVTVVKVISGQAIVWFEDGNIESISFANNTSLVITGDVNYDIVGNLMPNGRLSDTDHNPLNGEDGGILLPNNLTGLKILPFGSEQGSLGHVNPVTKAFIPGNIITAGSVSNVSVSGQIGGIYAGDGAFNPSSRIYQGGAVTSSVGDLDFNPIAAGLQNAFVFKPSDAASINPSFGMTGMQAGASIHDINVNKAFQTQMIAGSGNPNNLDFSAKTAPSGGSIYNITIQSASYDVTAGTPLPSYQLIAGDGGSGAKGGAGGFVQNISETNSSGTAIVQAGAGGVGAKGAGGAGGAIMNLNLQSSSTQYIVTAGNGGAGTPGGAGGSVANNSYANTTPAGGVIASADFTGDGSGDVLIVDQGSGQMVIEKSNPNGTPTSFSPLTQYTSSGNPVILIDPAGQGPVAAAAAYVNPADALPDFVVAYQGSNNIAVYENQTGGSFWDPALNGGSGGYKTDVVGLSFSPSKMALLDSSADEIVLVENTNGVSKIHLVTKTITTSGVSYQEVSGSFSMPLPCTGLVTTADGNVFASTSDGSIYHLTVTAVPNAPFSGAKTGQSVIGGISQLDVNSTGTQILALGNSGKTLEVFNEASGLISPAATINLSNLSAKASVAHFVPGTPADKIAVLGSAAGGSTVAVYDPNVANQVVVGYTPEKPITADRALLNFTVVNVGSGGATVPSMAALQTSLGQFSFDNNFGPTFTQYALPFATKTVTVSAGNGGTGVDLGTKLGKGGVGGSILGVNADASIVQISAGNGGDSQSGPAGAGGSFINPATITVSKGVSVNPSVTADASLLIYAGHGGSPTIAGGSAATGGAGGSLSGLTLTLNVGQNDLEIGLFAGYGGNGLGGAGGAGGSISNIIAVGHDGGLVLQSGDGGQSKAGATTSLGNGGAGGSISGVNYALTLDADVATVEKTHFATIATGVGGSAISGTGGAGGNLQNVSLNMQGANRTYDDKTAVPALVDAHLDSTVTIGVQLGDGGDGGKGGGGGGLSGFVYNQTLLQSFHDNTVAANYTVMSLVAGDGGKGTVGAGGNGGGISLTKPISGVTSYDPDAVTPGNNQNRIPLIVTSGNGGDGATNGGVGGSITGLVAQNPVFGSDGSQVINATLLLGTQVTAGHGGAGTSGNGGAGGSVANSTIGVQAADLNYQDEKSNTAPGTPILPDVEGGILIVTAGDGGHGGVAGTSAAKAKGGAGGSVAGGQFGLVSTIQNIGMLIGAGSGGDGIAGGGTGGGLTGLSLNMSQSTDALSALLLAGDGGAANSAAGTGGKGGAVTNIVELKDTNSSINLIQAGNGGDNPLGKGGAGGNVSQIHTVGFIGRPSDAHGSLGVFDQIVPGDYIPQGLFSGRGGTGVTNGVAGSIVNVIARQIAAMSAAEDPTAEANGTKGTFAPASKIANVTADLIGFDAVGSGAYTDSLGGDTSPSSAVPLDGFVLASVIQNVNGPRAGFEFSS